MYKYRNVGISGCREVGFYGDFWLNDGINELKYPDGIRSNGSEQQELKNSETKG